MSSAAKAFIVLCIVVVVGAWLITTAPEPPSEAERVIVTDGINVVIYEDGSGVQYVGRKEVRTFPEKTFVWQCRVMGNRQCDN